jgi:hypothetical protein
VFACKTGDTNVASPPGLVCICKKALGAWITLVTNFPTLLRLHPLKFMFCPLDANIVFVSTLFNVASPAALNDKLVTPAEFFMVL